MREKPENAQAVIDADHDDAFRRKVLAVVTRLGTRSRLKPATVEPHHHRQAIPRGLRRRPDIQVQAILAHRPVGPVAENHVGINWRLHTAWSELGGFANAFPRLYRLWRSPSQCSHRGRGEGNPAEDANARRCRSHALNDPALRLYPIVGQGVGGAQRRQRPC